MYEAKLERYTCGSYFYSKWDAVIINGQTALKNGFAAIKVCPVQFLI